METPGNFEAAVIGASVFQKDVDARCAGMTQLMRISIPSCPGSAGGRGPGIHGFSPRPVWVIALGLLALAACKKENSYSPPLPAEVGVAAPLQQKITPYLELIGNTVAFNSVDLQARVEGFLQEIDYKDGAQAKKGDVLFVIEPAPYQAKLKQAQAQAQATQATLSQATNEYNRQLSLSQKGYATASTLDVQKAARDSAQAQLLNDQAGVSIAAINLGYTSISAPFDGVVTAHQQSVGALVGVTGPTTLATIVQIEPIYVTFNLSEQDVLRIRQALQQHGVTLAQLGQIPIDIGLMTDQGFPHRGMLDYAAPQVDATTGTLTARAIFPNADHMLLPGFFVRVRVPLILQTGEALLVPDRALGANQAGSYLLVLNKDDVVEQRKVETGQQFGDLRQIMSGLSADDRVVVDGLARAVPGEKVAPKAATIAPPPPDAAPAP
jgi:membrane fusion protein, multidrug efflux system